MKTKKLFGILLAICLTLSLLPTQAWASSFTDAHGNVIELDDTLEAYAEAALTGADDAARKRETNLGDLWTDALRWFAVSGKINGFFEEDDVAAGNTAVAVDADHIVALWNGGNLRADIPAGKFGAAELAEVLPYPNKVAVVYMTGAQLKEALEAASQALPYNGETAAACASFMQVSGLKYTIDLSKPFDRGEAYGKSWFKAASLGRVNITEVNGKALDEAATYAVITSNANFNGMDSSYIFKEAAEANEKSAVTTAVVRDAVWTYLDEELNNVVREETYGKAQGRIRMLFTDAHGNVIELDDTAEAYTERALNGADDAARKEETNLGDLWTDALRWFAVSGKINGYFDEDDVAAGNTAVAVDADHIVALWNGGNLRADIPAGKFGAAELAEVLPYPNRVAVVYMTGAQLKEALEAASQALPYRESTAAACASFMQVSGLKYTVNTASLYDRGEAYGKSWFKAASLSRVSITEVNGQAFDPAATYAVVTSNANFNGMDSSYIFKEAAEANEKSAITTAVVRDVVWMYLSEKLGGVVSEAEYGPVQGRIILNSAGGTMAYERRQTVEIDGRKVELTSYALKDENGFERNFFRVREIAQQLTGTKAQFDVKWEDNAVKLITGTAYTPLAYETRIPFSGDREYTAAADITQINGEDSAIQAIALHDSNGGGYTYYKLRDLGRMLGFNVDWTAERGIFIETDKPYEG